MYKVQRIGTKTMVITETYEEAASIAKGDAKLNNTALIISKQIKGKWYRVEAISRTFEIIPRVAGYEIRKHNGKRYKYLYKVHNGEYTWIDDYTYSKIYKNFSGALAVFKALKETEK